MTRQIILFSLLISHCLSLPFISQTVSSYCVLHYLNSNYLQLFYFLSILLLLFVVLNEKCLVRTWNKLINTFGPTNLFQRCSSNMAQFGSSCCCSVTTLAVCSVIEYKCWSTKLKKKTMKWNWKINICCMRKIYDFVELEMLGFWKDNWKIVKYANTDCNSPWSRLYELRILNFPK